jgi:hypothetical protein
VPLTGLTKQNGSIMRIRKYNDGGSPSKNQEMGKTAKFVPEKSYDELSFLEKANYAFSPSMYESSFMKTKNQAPAMGMLGKLDKTLGLIKSGKKFFKDAADATRDSLKEEARSQTTSTPRPMTVKFNRGGKNKSTVNKAGNYTKPGMRKRMFQRIKAGSKGGPPGKWSARKAQLLAKAYKKAGGGYRS